MNVALVITLGVVAFGLGLGLALGLYDLRIYRERIRRLARATGGTLGARNIVRGTRHERAFTLSLAHRENRPALVRIEVPGVVAHDLIMAKRDFVARVAEGSGLVKPFCTGDAAIDERLSVTAADPAFARELLNDASARASSKELFDAGLETLSWSVHEQALIAEWTSRGGDAGDGAIANAVLERIAAYLPSLPPRHAAPSGAGRAPGAPVDGSVAVVLVAFGLVGLGGLGALVFDARYPPIQRDELLAGASALSVLGTACLGWLSWRVARRNIVGYRYWLPLMPVLAAGTWVSSYALLVWANGALDRAEPHLTLEAVHDKSRLPRDGTFDYRLHTASGALDVPRLLFQQVETGSAVSIVTHRGRLGVPWRHPGSDVRVSIGAPPR